jgi:DNA invertase Pin-like site-specific DNA recombinase
MLRKNTLKLRRSKSRQEIADEYGISRRTLYRWIQRTEISMPPGLIPPKVQDMIYDEFGSPFTSRYFHEEKFR